MLLIKTDKLVQIKTETKNDETLLINNIVNRFKKDGYMASNFKILNSNPGNNELFAEIKIVDNMKHVKMTLNAYKTYTINNIFNANYTVNEFQWTTEPNSDYTNSMTFIISNSEIGEQLQLGFSHNAKLEVEDNVFKTVIHPATSTFKEINSNNIISNNATIGNVEYPNTSSTQYKIMRLNNNNQLEWADNKKVIVDSGLNINVIEEEGLNNELHYQANLNTTLTNLTKITTNQAKIGNVEYPSTSSTQNKIMKLNNLNQLEWADDKDTITTLTQGNNITITEPTAHDYHIKLSDDVIKNSGNLVIGDVMLPTNPLASKTAGHCLKLYSGMEARWEKIAQTVNSTANQTKVDSDIYGNYTVGLPDLIDIPANIKVNSGNLEVNNVVLPGPLSTKAIGKTIKINGNVGDVYSTDWAYPINNITGTTNEITANTTNGDTVISLPALIEKNQAKISYFTANYNYIDVDATQASNPVVKVSNVFGTNYSTHILDGLQAKNGLNECKAQASEVSITDGTNKIALYPQSLISINSSFGNNGDVLMSQGGILPVKWYSLTETYSTTIQMKTGDITNAWLANLYLTRNNNVVSGRLSLNGGSLINYTSTATTGILGKVTIPTNLLPTVNQFVGKCDICYFSTSSASTLSAFGTMSIYVLVVSGQLTITLRTDPIGTGIVNPSFGVSATNVYPYFAPGYGWNSVVDTNPNAGINFQYFIS